MYRLTADPDCLMCMETGAYIPRGHRDWPEEWLLTNIPAPVPPRYELYTAAHFKAVRDAAWAWMTHEVVKRRYDSIETCCSYYNSGVPRYRAEARAMVAWRDDVNLALEQMVVSLPAGIETFADVLPLLPQPEAYPWPEAVSLPLDVVPEVHVPAS
ncbi:hypothetical protein [Stenotrophomonas sp.]|uniref:hypothetical protein n=1 Tax=Stenotrophomonas sp. TaxID=69392 RepID=UPI00289D3F76|nr:hypothetical protein [Stenotrophomonas sp.]